MSGSFFFRFKKMWAATRSGQRPGCIPHLSPLGAFSRLGLILFLSAFIICVDLFSTGDISAHDTSCYRLPRSKGELICPPPFGGLLVDINGNITCGPGFCARDSYGKVRCSSVPGGAVDMDESGNVLCVGGCVDGATSYCVAPRP